MTLIDPVELEQELDEQYLAEMRWQLDRQMRGALVDWAREIGGNFFFAVESVSRGYWDDVHSDLRRGRLTLAEANQIADKAAEFRLITARQLEYYKAQFMAIGLEGEAK